MSGSTSFRFDRSTTGDFERGAAIEWLETNGIGGWASSTLNGSHSRRYHGLLVAAIHPPYERLVLISRLDETLVTADGRFELSCNRFPGAIHPTGYEFLTSFRKELFPTWEYEVPGVLLRKTVACIHGENTTIVRYEMVRGRATLELRPFCAARNSHALTHANDALNRSSSFQNGILELSPYPGIPRIYISVPGSRFDSDGYWWYNFEYPWELVRGLDFREDLFTHGVFTVSLLPGALLSTMLSTEDPSLRDAQKLFEDEWRRRKELTRAIRHDDGFLTALTLAADQFIVSRADGRRTVIAGYHWFTDWGRDTMIALPGLCLVTGRFPDARSILENSAASVSEGMVPNCRADDGAGVHYNSVDASLWFFVAVHKYLEYTGDLRFVRTRLLPALSEIVTHYERGTRYSIGVREDHLLYAGESGLQLTWMDAKIGDYVVTPRVGAPVEVNALWYNALRILSDLFALIGKSHDAESLKRRAEEVKKAFIASFWNEPLGGLYDCVGPYSNDDSIRPNQIFALSLPYPLLADGRARRVLTLVEERLLTPVGLRSLDREHPSYRGRYGGGVFERDSSYHQGTVWSWLVGPYITALLRFGGRSAPRKARRIVAHFRAHLSEGGVGTVSEIFDGDPPHAPHGCIAQAWSVAEVLRVCIEELHIGRNGNARALSSPRSPTV